MTTASNPIAATQVAATTKSTALQGSSTGVMTNMAGMDFWSMILSGFGGTGTQTTTDKPTVTDNQTSGTLFSSQNNPLASLQVALASQTTTDADGNLVVGTQQTSGQLQGQLELTNKIINQLKNMLPETSDKEGMMNKLLAKLQSKSDTLQASLSALQDATITKDTAVDDIPMPMLVALGLNPSEISQVTQQIKSLEEKLGRDVTVEDLIAGIGGLIPPAQNTAAAAMGFAAGQKTANSDTADLVSLDDRATPSDDLAAQLNALDVGGEEGMEGTLGGKKSRGLELPASDATTQNSAAKPAAPATIETDVKKAFESFKQHVMNIMNTNNAQAGDMTFPASLFNGDVDASLLPAGSTGVFATSSLPFGAAAQAANASVAAPSAGASHPAVQVVAATITKSGQAGSEDVMNVRLDPPELGAVSIRLQFGKDKTVKAHLTVEKAETYNMLQRDGQALERALQEAGLDAGDGSISFELAQDNHFGNDNNGQGGGERNFGNAGRAGTQEDTAQIIQSTVNWAIDPSTGHIRYSMFA